MPVTEGCKHELEITVPVSEIQTETERIVADIQKRAKLPGFRPGKAPASLIRQKFHNEIRQDVLEHILPKAFRAKADEEHLQVVGTPNVTDVHFHEGERRFRPPILRVSRLCAFEQLARGHGLLLGSVALAERDQRLCLVTLNRKSL